MIQALNEYTRMIKETDMELQALFLAHPDISPANKYKEKEGVLRDFFEKRNRRLSQKMKNSLGIKRRF